MAPTPEEGFASFLRRYMKDHRFRSVDIAFFTRASDKTIHEWLRGKGPDAWTARGLREHLETHVDQFRELRLTVLGVTGLAGCASPYGAQHWLPGSAPGGAALERAEYECDRDSAVPYGRTHLGVELYKKCMVTKGYVRR